MWVGASQKNAMRVLRTRGIFLKSQFVLCQSIDLITTTIWISYILLPKNSPFLPKSPPQSKPFGQNLTSNNEIKF